VSYGDLVGKTETTEGLENIMWKISGGRTEEPNRENNPEIGKNMVP
jgi:hypothetical protein